MLEDTCTSVLHEEYVCMYMNTWCGSLFQVKEYSVWVFSDQLCMRHAGNVALFVTTILRDSMRTQGGDTWLCNTDTHLPTHLPTHPQGKEEEEEEVEGS